MIIKRKHHLKLNNTTANWVLVRVPSEFNNIIGTIKDEHGNEKEIIVDTSFRDTHHSRICAEVIASPTYLNGDTIIYENYPGTPRPLTYRGHDDVLLQVKTLAPKRRRPENIYPPVCATFEPTFTTLLNEPIRIKNGQTVYFHYNVLLNETNYLGRDESGQLVYKVHYSQLFCVVDNGNITMLNGYVLVSEYYEDDTEEIVLRDSRFEWKFKGKTKNGLVVQVDEKPKYLIGRLEHIGPGLGTNTRMIEPGELIMYRPKSEFKNTIEGTEYYVMRQWDIVAIVISAEELREFDRSFQDHNIGDVGLLPIKPVGDYVMLTPETPEIKSKTKLHVYDPKNKDQEFKPGELFILGTTVSHKKNGLPTKGNVLGSGENTKGWNGKKVMYIKGPAYVWVEEYELAFVREGDIQGEFI